MKKFIVTKNDLLNLYNILQKTYIVTNEQFNETTEKILKSKKLSDDTYTVIPWPESQKYMKKPWFDKEAILDIEMKHGDSAYFIPTKYLNYA